MYVMWDTFFLVTIFTFGGGHIFPLNLLSAMKETWDSLDYLWENGYRWKFRGSVYAKLDEICADLDERVRGGSCCGQYVVIIS